MRQSQHFGRPTDAGDWAGASVAVSSDGTTAVVGAPAPFSSTVNGSVWVFTRSSGQPFGSPQKLEDPAKTKGFGSSVAIAPDGNTILVGAPQDASGEGKVLVFSRSPGHPFGTQPAQEIADPDGTSGASFGASVAVSSPDGEAALIGAPGSSGGSGAAFRYTRSGVSSATWSLNQEIQPDDENGAAEFGRSVAVSTHGEILLVGGPEQAPGGAAWAFADQGGVWMQEGDAIEGSTEEDKAFGASVALSAGGDKALVGDPYANQEVGAAFELTRSSGAWGVTQEFTSEHACPGEEYGRSVALSANARSALIGAPAGGDCPEFETIAAGLVYVYGENEEEVAHTTASDPNGPEFGASVALSSDGTTLLAGAPREFGEGESGAWAFEGPSSATVAPAVNTDPASAVAEASATLNATVNPSGENVTACEFEYGPTIAYGSGPVPCGSLPGSGTSPVAVSASLKPLNAGSEYHFRIVATSNGGKSYGSDESFKTLPYAKVQSQGTASGEVEIINEPGTTVTAASTGPIPPGQSPPSGATIIGALSYTITGVPVGGTTTVTLKLPAGSDPTRIYKQIGPGDYEQIPSAVISGDTVALTLTDGGEFDQDEETNGRIEDPVVPVHEEAPTVAKLKRAAGPVTGSETVTITGTNLAGATAVAFGSLDATGVTALSSTSLTAVTPAEPAGKVNVSVTTPAGTSPAAKGAHYTFRPTITGISPVTASTGGGTNITVTGTGFVPGNAATQFKLGSKQQGGIIKATSVSCSSGGECTLSAPAHPAGIVDVKAIVNKAASAKVSADRLTYSETNGDTRSRNVRSSPLK